MKPKNYTDKSAMLVGTDADPVTAGPKYFAENTPEQEKENAAIRQSSMYNDKNRARIDNNQFFETRSNPCLLYTSFSLGRNLRKWCL